MGRRLRLAQALADGTLEGDELELAKANRVVVQEAENIKRMKYRKETKMVESKIRKVAKHG